MNPIRQAIEALSAITERGALYFGEQHNTVIEGRAALSALQSLQGVELPKPAATLHDDGYWTPQGTEEGRNLNSRLARAGTREGVYTADQLRTAVAAAMARGAVPQEVARLICQEVAELPDRNSPEDWPEAMLVTSDELRSIVLSVLAAAPTPEKRHELQTNDE